MPFHASNLIGGIFEGVLSLKNGAPTLVEDTDGPAIPLAEVLKAWEGKRVRINVADLEVLTELVDMGMEPGREREFVESLSGEDLTKLLAPRNPLPSGDNQ